MELGELKALRYLSLDFSVILRHNTNCDSDIANKEVLSAEALGSD